MPKFLSQSGLSLADVYDVEGSIAGIDQLHTAEGIHLLHEMGGVLFSERFSGDVRMATTGAIAQNITFDVEHVNLPEAPTRLFGVTVIADVAARITSCSVCIQDRGSNREIPIFVWDTADDVESAIRLQVEASVVNAIIMRPTQALPGLPTMLTGVSGLPNRVDSIFFRGITAGFGAGTVTARMLLQIGFPRVEGVASQGLPIPSW